MTTGAWRVILKLMGPAVFGVSVGQLSMLINTIFASLLVTGSVSWLYYADRLMEFPAGLLGVALGTVLYCHRWQSTTMHGNSTEAYSQVIRLGIAV